MIEPPDIAELVRDLRLRLGLTQEEFAAKLRVTLLAVSRWENRCAKPSRRTMKLLLSMLSKTSESAQDFPTGVVHTVRNGNGSSVINTKNVENFRKLSQTCYRRSSSSAIKLQLLERSKIQLLERLCQKRNIPQELADRMIAELTPQPTFNVTIAPFCDFDPQV